jgi:hypothetical protein
MFTSGVKANNKQRQATEAYYVCMAYYYGSRTRPSILNTLTPLLRFASPRPPLENLPNARF